MLSMVGGSGEYDERAKLIKSIDKDSESLQQYLDLFLKSTPRFKIVSFYERMKTKKVVGGPNDKWCRSGDYITAVDKDSALLNVQKEISIFADKDHSNLVQFNTESDVTYKAARGYLAEWTDEWILQQLEAGFDTRNPVESATKSLYCAATKGTVSFVGPLFATCHDHRAGGNFGEKALLFAARNGRTDMVKLLLEKGVGNEEKDDGMAIHWAAFGGHTDTVRLLLESGANIEARSDLGSTELHWAAQEGQTATIQLLLAKGANIAAPANNGSTPSHCAAQYGRVTTIQLLREKGANIHTFNNNAWKAWNFANANGHKMAAGLLR